MDIATAALLGQLVGSVIVVYLLHAIWEFALFKRVMDNPVAGKLASVIAAYLTAVVVYGMLGSAGVTRVMAVYLFGGAVVGFFAVRRGIKLRDSMASDDPVEDVFS